MMMPLVEERAMFDLGPERRLIITADAIRVVGWDGPGVKCVLEKSLLAAGDELEAPEFAALKLVHRHGQASELVGRSDAEVAADETKFLAEKRDVPLSEEQLANRRRLVASMSNRPLARSSVASFWIAAIVTSVGADAMVIRATPIRSNAAASGMPGLPVMLTGAPTAFTKAAIVAGSRRPKG